MTRCKRKKRRLPIVLCSECKAVVDEETLREKSNRKKKLCRDCYCGSDYKTQPKLWTHSMLSHF